jgi:hypothetical protein
MEQKAKELLTSVLLDLSGSMGALFGEGNQFQELNYDHEFEVMRRFVAMFLMQTDPIFEKKVSDLRTLLENPSL